MKTGPLVILGLLAAGAAGGEGAHIAQHTSGHSAAAGAGIATTTTVESVTPHGTNSSLVLRRAGSSLLRLTVPTATTIGTRNAGRIVAADLRSGDRLVLERDGSLRDLSQVAVSLSGVVSYAPLSRNDVMTVQVTPSRTILVDVAPQTRFSDAAGRTSTSPTDIVDADQVTVQGVLDTTMDEMVVAQGIVRSGPKISKTYAST